MQMGMGYPMDVDVEMGMELLPELQPELKLEPEPNTKECQRHQSAECCTMKLTVSYLHINKMLFFKLF